MTLLKYVFFYFRPFYHYVKLKIKHFKEWDILTKRTLRYNHKTCPGKKIDRNGIPVKKREKTVVEKNISIPEEIIEKEINKRIQDKLLQKIRVKEEKIKKLSSQFA